jgi:uncharacterized OsmC-like protein
MLIYIRKRITLNWRIAMNTEQAVTKEVVMTVNGLGVREMVDTVQAITDDPSLGQFEFRAENQWINGGENRSTIKGFYGAGAEDESRDEPFVFTNGEPPVLLGNNEGANPVEFLLHALAGCVTTTTVLHAAARGIEINRLSTRLVGVIDVQGLLNLGDNVPVGYQSIDIQMSIDAECSDEELDELLAFAKEHSPVCNTVCRPVPVNIQRVK